jgi:hypothetical protein
MAIMDYRTIEFGEIVKGRPQEQNHVENRPRFLMPFRK